MVGAREQLAGDRQAGAISAQPLGGLLVVATVGRVRMARHLGGLIERPAKRRRTLAGEVAGGAAAVGLRHRDVHPGVADCTPRGAKAPRVAQLGEDRHRGQLTDPVVGLQRPAAGLAAGVGAQLTVKRAEALFEAVDYREPDLDLGARRLGELKCFEPGAVIGREQAAPLRRAVVVELGLDALLSLAALGDQRVAQADLRAQLEDVGGRYPGLRQATLPQQLAQVAGVGAVRLRPLLGTT